MATIPKELHDLLAGGHNVWVATVAPDGTPNVSIKGSGALLDEAARDEPRLRVLHRPHRGWCRR